MSAIDTPLDWVDRAVPEAELQKVAVQLMKMVGWQLFIDRMAWRSDAGWPDIHGVHSGFQRSVYIECKTEKGKLSPNQEEWREVLLAANQEYFLLRPSNWDDFVRFVVPPRMLDPFKIAMKEAIDESNRVAPKRRRSLKKE